jgi:exonuclease III
MDIIAELQTSIIDFSFEKLNSIVFNPFELNDDQNILPLVDIDPDLNFFNTVDNNSISCNYFFPEAFNKECQKRKICNTHFSALHQNIRSLPKHFQEIDIFIKSLSVDFSIIGFSETWLNDTNEMYYDIDGYTSVSKHRQNKSGGGVMLLIKNHIPYTVREDLSIFDEKIECIFVEIEKHVFQTEKNILVGLLYRPPDTNVDKFNRIFSDLLSKIGTKNYCFYMLGDYNINLLNSESHSPTASFIDILFENNLTPAITKPTRVTEKTATVIDNIFHNCFSNKSAFHGIIYSDISDHFPVFIIDYSILLNNCTHTYMKTRDYSERNKLLFKRTLEDFNWDQVYTYDNPAEAFEFFHKSYLDIYTQSFPEKQIKMGYITRKPWLSNDLKIMIKRKNKLFYKMRKNPTKDNVKFYKYFRNRLNTQLRAAERVYYKNYLDTNKQNLRKTWSILKKVINKRSSSKGSDSFLINGTEIKDKKHIANSFNKYFVNIGPNLSKKITTSNDSFKTFLPNPTVNSIYINQVTEKEIKRLIKDLKPAAAGWDSISSEIVKETFSLFIKPLTYVINLSLHFGFFPNSMKIAKVLPLFKNGEKRLVSNYRPISILPVFSKLLERIMYNRLLCFIDKNHLLYENQFGFRIKHSTALALSLLVDKISSSLNDNLFMVGVFLDFSKAFDTVDHSILLNKLHHYGIRGLAHKWIESYLTDRYQYVCFDAVSSDRERITCGVPQGSILGPLLFLLYINDIAEVSNRLFAILFADDSNIFFTGNNIHHVINSMNQELSNVVLWLNSNKLSLNIDKSNFMIFSRQKIRNHDSIYLNNIPLQRITETKFLGVYIDENLSWKRHVIYTRNKIAKGIGLLIKARKTLPPECLQRLYYSFIYPYLTYCLEIWGGTYNSHMNDLILQQKRVLRLMCNVHRLTKSRPLFQKLKILRIDKLYVYRILWFMYKYENGLLPQSFSLNFVRRRDIHSYNTRNRDQINIPRVTSESMKKSFLYNAVTIYNKFHESFDFAIKPNKFKKNVKEYLLKIELNS